MSEEKKPPFRLSIEERVVDKYLMKFTSAEAALKSGNIMLMLFELNGARALLPPEVRPNLPRPDEEWLSFVPKVEKRMQGVKGFGPEQMRRLGVNSQMEVGLEFLPYYEALFIDVAQKAGLFLSKGHQWNEHDIPNQSGKSEYDSRVTVS